MENYPFGEPVIKVEQRDRTPKKVFILGVYASAVHAKWVSLEGKILINALAVASEPYIFWRGDKAEEIVSKIKLPEQAGKLVAADEKFNGPSGNVLDEKYLIPLKLTRDDCWLCDLVPYSMLNPKQVFALHKHESLVNKFGLKKYNMRTADLMNRKIDERRRIEILSEIKESKAKYLITLGNEPLSNFVKFYNPGINTLNQIDPYGTIRDINIDGSPMKLISLVHPRQAGKLGGYSKKWNEIHSNWTITTAIQIMRLLKIEYEN